MGLIFDSLSVDVAVGVATSLVLICIFYSYSYGYWRRRNIPHIPAPFSIFGNVGDMLFMKKTPALVSRDNYNKLEGEPYGGFFIGPNPVMLIRDPEVIKQVLVKNFTSFMDRHLDIDEKVNPVEENLFFMKGEKWRWLRSKLTPTFSSGKLKMMFHVLTECASEMNTYVEPIASKQECIEMRELFAQYNTEIVGEKNDISRNDFLQLLIQLKKKGYVTDDSTQSKEDAYLYYKIGDEASSVRKEFETLRKYPTIPILERKCTKPFTFPGTDYLMKKGDKLSIPAYAIQHDPKYYPDPERFDPERFTEEAKQSRHPFTYLPFGEGPRICIAAMYSSAHRRFCSPLLSLTAHAYNSDRTKSVNLRTPHVSVLYLIEFEQLMTVAGMRFALMQIKVGLVSLLSKYKFSPCEKTDIPIVLLPKAFFLTPTNGIWLKITNRD
uniref:Cytochrome P450 n=1 Tax=Timema douglasi TaxID=61478 RepID=A0A7R8VEZ5_TIMDO|nr:unnamed protein product [Timema douglasi]